MEHGGCVSYGQWTESEAGQSSTWRELAVVLQVLLGVAKKLTNHHVRWFKMFTVGSKKNASTCASLKSVLSPCTTTSS